MKGISVKKQLRVMLRCDLSLVFKISNWIMGILLKFEACID